MSTVCGAGVHDRAGSVMARPAGLAGGPRQLGPPGGGAVPRSRRSAVSRPPARWWKLLEVGAAQAAPDAF